MKQALLLALLALTLTGCNPAKIIDVATRAYACPNGANPGPACKGPLVFVGNLYFRVDEEAARVQIHVEQKGDSGLLSKATVAFKDCNIQNRLNWACSEGRSMTSYFHYSMRDGVFRADWTNPDDTRAIPIVAISGPVRWLYRFGWKTADARLLTQYR